MAKKTKPIPKTTKTWIGAAAVQACIVHLQRAQYHTKAGRLAVAGQHQAEYLVIRETLNGARRRALDAMIPYLGAYTGPEVTEYVQLVPATRQEGVGIGFEVSEELKTKLVALAAQQGTSLRGLIRGALERLVAQPAPAAAPAAPATPPQA